MCQRVHHATDPAPGQENRLGPSPAPQFSGWGAHATPHSAVARPRPTTGLLALLAALFVVLGPCLAASAHAQKARTRRPEAEPPAPADVMAAYRTLRKWLDSWAVPAAPPDGPAALAPAPGAAVVLRFQSQTVGRGSDILASGAAVDRESSVQRTAWRAFLAAFSEADRRMPGPRDATRPQALREAGRDVLVSLELAGEPTPIEPLTFAELDAAVAPAIEGVAVRLGNRIEAAFPSSMLLTNATPSAAARALVAKITGSPEVALLEAKDLREKNKIAFLRFRVSHLAQPLAGEEPRFVTRGGRIVEVGQLDTARLRTMADAMAGALRAMLPERDAPLGIRGTYRPWTGDWEADFAPPHQQALAALALRRYARAAWAAPDASAAAADAADRILHELDDAELSETPPWTRAGAAAVAVLALLEPAPLPRPGTPERELSPAHRHLLSECSARVRKAWMGREFEPGLSPPEQAAVAAAWVRLAPTGPEARAEPLRKCFRDATPAALVGLMPLAGWAEIEAAAPGQAPAAAVALRQMRTQLWVSQLKSESAGPERADMVGGLTIGGPGSLPTWEGLRPLAAMATMLRVKTLTPRDEVGGEVTRLLLAARALRQLQADENLAWMYASPERAMGAVRSAVWDQSMPPDATSMGLLMTVELLESLEAIAGGR